jgi:uncharacterized integral membrane protein
MIRKTIAFLILAPLALAIIALAIANRQTVTISFDPFNAVSPAYVAQAPLFLLVFMLVIAGVLIGGIAAWLRQSRWRRRARRLEAHLHRAEAEVERLKRHAKDAGAATAAPGQAESARNAAHERRSDMHPPPQWPPPRALPPAAA